MKSWIGGAILMSATAALATPAAYAAPPSVGASGGRAPAATAPAARSPAPGRPAGFPPATSGNSPPPAPEISQDAAARARMHECAHQWASIKKAGNAGATTWKEFSATCLVVSK